MSAVERIHTSEKPSEKVIVYSDIWQVESTAVTRFGITFITLKGPANQESTVLIRSSYVSEQQKIKSNEHGTAVVEVGPIFSLAADPIIITSQEEAYGYVDLRGHSLTRGSRGSINLNNKYLSVIEPGGTNKINNKKPKTGSLPKLPPVLKEKKPSREIDIPSTRPAEAQIKEAATGENIITIEENDIKAIRELWNILPFHEANNSTYKTILREMAVMVSVIAEKYLKQIFEQKRFVVTHNFHGELTLVDAVNQLEKLLQPTSLPNLNTALKIAELYNLSIELAKLLKESIGATTVVAEEEVPSAESNVLQVLSKDSAVVSATGPIPTEIPEKNPIVIVPPTTKPLPRKVSSSVEIKKIAPRLQITNIHRSNEKITATLKNIGSKVNSALIAEIHYSTRLGHTVEYVSLTKKGEAKNDLKDELNISFTCPESTCDLIIPTVGSLQVILPVRNGKETK